MDKMSKKNPYVNFSYVLFDIHYVEYINPKKEVLSCQALVIQIDKSSIM